MIKYSNYNFEMFKDDIESIKGRYISNQYSKDKLKEEYIIQRNNLIDYVDWFQSVPKKDLKEKPKKQESKQRLKNTSMLLKEYKKIRKNAFYIDGINESENIVELLEVDYKCLKSSIKYKILCAVIPLIQVMITIYFNYGILFMPFENLVKYILVMVQLYAPAYFFDYLKDTMVDDINKIFNLKYTLKDEEEKVIK